MENASVQYDTKKYPNFKEYLWYKEHQADLMQRYYGRFIVIKDEKIWGDFGTWRLAWVFARKMHAPGSYIIQHCVEQDPRLIGHKFTFIEEK